MNKKIILVLCLLATLLVAGCTQQENKQEIPVAIQEREIIRLEPQENINFYVICHNTSDFTVSFQYYAGIQFMEISRKHEGEQVKFYPDIRYVVIDDSFYRDMELQYFIHCRTDFSIPIKETKFYGGNEIYSISETAYFFIEDNYNLRSFHEKIKQEIERRFDSLW